MASALLTKRRADDAGGALRYAADRASDVRSCREACSSLLGLIFFGAYKADHGRCRSAGLVSRLGLLSRRLSPREVCCPSE